MKRYRFTSLPACSFPGQQHDWETVHSLANTIVLRCRRCGARRTAALEASHARPTAHQHRPPRHR
jgi:hypothetical protein